MAASTRYSRASSPSRSTSHTASTTPRLKIVKRLVIEGKAERDAEGRAEGASIKMYLRIAIPVNSCLPGSTVPLFPEDNLKILNSQVHPLDSNQVPYNFSNSQSPLLKKAARALGLGPRSKESYMSLFGASLSPSLSTNGVPPVDKRYAGDISVSQYQVSYILPKEFPPGTRTYDGGSYGRRSSPHELHFMAAIELWASFVSRPPSHPYLLSIPVPNCLSNQIKLKIFQPASASLTSSLASLSSAEGDTWDLTSEPRVTKASSRSRSLSRGSSYQSFADDESSDSSGSGFVEGYGIQGTFPSTDYMRVRWARRVDPADVPSTSDGRQRVGIKEVKGDTTCIVLDKARLKGKSRGRSVLEEVDEGILMKLEYTGTCKGVWFPGVATMLGMDVGLDAGDCDVSWVPGEEQKWTVNGSAGFTGFKVGPPPKPASQRKPTDPPPINVIPSTPNGKANMRAEEETSRYSSSSASLLRAPLPSGPDDSFSEGSPNMTPMSSIASLATIPSSPERRSRASSLGARTDTDAEEETRPPKIPLSIHLNMNELIPPQKNTFTFTISGTVLVTPPQKPFRLHSRQSSTKYSGSDSDSDVEPVILPQFRVLYAERETLSSVVRNELEDAALDIFNSKGRISDAHTRKTVLQPGTHTKCGADGARLAIREISLSDAYSHRRREPSVDSAGRRTPSRPRTPSGFLPRPNSSMSMRQTYMPSPARPARTGALMIPHVAVSVALLAAHREALPARYTVKLAFAAPSDAGSEWLEFGLAHPLRAAADDGEGPEILVSSATVERESRRFETSTSEKPVGKLPALGLSIDEEEKVQEKMTWVKVHVGAAGGNVEVLYQVTPGNQPAEQEARTGWLAGKRTAESKTLDVLVPTFVLPVGLLEITVLNQKKFHITAESNLRNEAVQDNGIVFSEHRVDEFFGPKLTVTAVPATLQHQPTAPAGNRQTTLVACICVMSLIAMALSMTFFVENQALRTQLEQLDLAVSSYASLSLTPTEVPEPETMTTTVYTTTTITVEPPPPSSTSSSAATEPVPAVPTPSKPSTPQPSAIPTLTLSVPTSTTTAQGASSTDAMLSSRDLAFLWPVHFDLPPLDLPETVRTTAAAVLRGVDFAWQLCRKVFHYPLDPP